MQQIKFSIILSLFILGLGLVELLLIGLSTNANAATASWYGPGFHGKRTASGEIYNQNALTAASNQFKFGTRVRVTNLKNNKSVVVRINDTGGFGKYGRAIDLSKAANQAINCGLCQVKITKLY